MRRGKKRRGSPRRKQTTFIIKRIYGRGLSSRETEDR